MIFDPSWLGLVLAAFFAGFVDAVAGGGGLIQVPALLGAMPESPTATLFGTNKLSSIFGTASATLRYVRRIAVPWVLVLPAALAAFVFSFAGAASVAWFPPAVARPVVFVLLVGVILYTLLQPALGLEERRSCLAIRHERLAAIAVGALLGFYDGFFGPGTGSFLIFAWVRFFGMDFLKASVSAKVVNLSTNAAALSFFIPAGHVFWALGGLMALANVAGAQLGARAALRGGSLWVRRVFLLVASALVLKIGFDLFKIW
jgi:uncharacterized membrane protein YfcA